MLIANSLTIDSNKSYNSVFNNKNDVINNKIKNKNIFKKFSKKFLLESLSAIKAGMHFPVSLKNHLNSYSVNLKKITKEQSKKTPILLLHGKCGYWGYFLNLIKAIKKNNLGPIYTVQLPHRSITYKDFEIIEKKIKEIKKQYEKHNIKNPKINFIGYSRGGGAINEFYQNTNKFKWQNIKKIISIGSFLLKSELEKIKRKYPDLQNKIYEVEANYDIFIPEKSLLPKEQTFNLNTGHFGLLFSKKVHNKIINWLKKP